MSTLIAIEVTKILRHRLNQITMAVLCVLLVVVYVLLWLATGVISRTGTATEAVGQMRASLYLQETVPFAMLMLYFFGLVAGIVVIASNVGSEYGWNTVRTVTAAEPRRWLVLLAKVVAVWAMVVAGLVLGLAVVLTTSAFITLAAGQFDLSFVDAAYLRDSAYAFLRLLGATAPYFALAVLFGVVGKSATAGIALSFGVLFLEGIVRSMMTLSGGWLAELPPYMLDANADALALATGGRFEEMLGSDSAALIERFGRPSVEHAAIVLLCWATVFLAASFWTFRRQDLEYQG